MRCKSARSITPDYVTDKILDRIQNSNLKIQDKPYGKQIIETQKKKLACDTCLTQNKKRIPQTEINKNKKLQQNSQIAHIYRNGIKQYQLDYYQMDSIQIQNEGKYEKLRLDHFDVVKQLLNYHKVKEEFQKEMKKILFTIEQGIRKNHNQINLILQNEGDWQELEEIQKQNQQVIAICVSQKEQGYFDDEEMQYQSSVKIMQNEQERTIQRLKVQLLHSNTLLNKIQQSVNEPMLGMAGLLNQVGQLKIRIDDLQKQMQQKDHEIQGLQHQLQVVFNVLDKITNIIKKYPTLFRQETAQNTLNLREFQYDLEMIYLLYSNKKQMEQKILNMQDQYDNLFKQIEDEKINQQKQNPILKDPKLRTLIDDLSRLILSKDPNAMSYDMRELIKEIYLQNNQDIIADQQQQIKNLQTQVDQIGNEYQTFRKSIIVPPKQPEFGDQEYTQSLFAQAQTIEQCLLKIN